MAVVCEVDLTRVVEFLSGQLGKGERSELEAHMAIGCDQCSGTITSLGGIIPEPEPAHRQMLAQPVLDTPMAQPAGVRGAAVLSH